MDVQNFLGAAGSDVCSSDDENLKGNMEECYGRDVGFGWKTELRVLRED